MRLLQRLPGDTFELTSVDNDNPPPYAILSHTWTEGQEVTYHELKAGTGRDKTGFKKIRFCGERAAADGLRYFWIDTCCIDKSTSEEVGTAINSMFKWYQRASRCYVYLSDVSVQEHVTDVVPEQISDAVALQNITWADAFQRSRWFTRGWTLQELIAPANVEFFSKEGKRLGSKISLEQQIHRITNIPSRALRGQSLADFSIEERMSWVTSRATSVKEDRVYCLLGIFGVFLPLIYGEGEAHAAMRLREEIEKRQEERGAERPERTRPSCLLPFRRDPDFIDCGTLLDEVQKKSSAPASRVALVGLGGVGKSQLAIEHCYRTVERSPETWVFWVHASNTARLEQSFREIAEQVKVRGRKDPQADVFKLVHDWLRDEMNGPWLLVVDNADDAAVLQTSTRTDGSYDGSNALKQQLARYLPPSRHGSVLVTSRTKSAATQIVEDSDVIMILPMHATAARALLHKKLGDEGDDGRDGMAELAAALDSMPLALVQAAAYIRKRAPRCSVRQYLEEYRQSDNRKTSLLNQEAGRLRRDEAASNSVLLTWQLSFNHLQSTRPSAADLLSLMSFFDRQGIHEALLHNPSGAPDERASYIRIANDFENDVITLRDYSFITVTRNADTFEMHSLVQLATRTWLENHKQLEKWKKQFIFHLCAELPTGQHENWEKCQALFPHAKAALAQRLRDRESLGEWAALLFKAAWYAWQRGKADEAEEMSTVSMEVRTEVLGEGHVKTLSSMEMVGLATELGGKYGEAEAMNRQTLAWKEKVLGPEHPDTLTSISNLALVLESQGKYEEAEAMNRQTLARREKVLGPEHPDTITSVYCLAHLLASQHRYKESLTLYERAWAAYQIVLGANHPTTRACRQHYAKAQKRAAAEYGLFHSSTQSPDSSESVHTGKVSR